MCLVYDFKRDEPRQEWGCGEVEIERKGVGWGMREERMGDGQKDKETATGEDKKE